MEIDKALSEAVAEAVSESNEEPELARKITLWLEAVHMGTESLNDRDATMRRIEVLLASVKEF